MNKKDRVFKNSHSVRDITFYYKSHLKEIRSKDYTVKFLDSVQGTGKSTAIRKDFSLQKNAMYIKSSRDKLKEDQELLVKETGCKEAFIITTLEDECTTFLADKKSKTHPIGEKVKRYRELGIPPDRIHSFICKDKNCSYPERDKSVDGLVMLSFNGLLVRVEHNDEAQGHLIGKPNKIYLDESDDFLTTVVIPFRDYNLYSKLKDSPLKPLVDKNSYVDLYWIHNPELLNELKTQFNELTGSEEKIENNDARIQELHYAISILENGYITGFNDKILAVVNAPKILWLFRFGIEKNIRIVCGSARLGKDLIERKKFEYYFYALQEKMVDILQSEYIDIVDLVLGESDREIKIKLLDKSDKILREIDRVLSKTIRFYSTPAPEGRTQLYLKSVEGHSLSSNRYKIEKYKSEEEHAKMKQKMRDRMEEVELHFGAAKQMMRMLYGIDLEGKKTLFITFKDLVRYIQAVKEKWKNNNLSPLFQVDLMKWFSNSMHGISAPDLGYECVVLYGDPVSKSVSDFCARLNLIPEERQKLRRGFVLKEDTDNSLRDIIIPSLIAEILEGIHRARGNVVPAAGTEPRDKLPVLIISNLMNPENEYDRKLVMDTLNADNIDLHNMSDAIEKKRYEANRDVELDKTRDELLGETEDVHLKFTDPNDMDGKGVDP